MSAIRRRPGLDGPPPAGAQPSDYPQKAVAPSPYFTKLSTLLLPLLAVRLLGALLSPIPDCDEVFNYWEQTHYLLHGEGLQTWEYSPEFAIRSYFYCAMHALVAGVAGLLLGTHRKVAIFYCVRCALGSINIPR